MKRLLLLWLLLLGFAACVAPGGPLVAKPQPPVVNLLAEADQLYQAHRYDEALARYEQYLRTSPQGEDWQRAWLRAAEIYGIKGNWLQARHLYEKLLGSPDLSSGVALQARFGVGQAQYKLGNLAEAERILGNLTAASLPAELRFKTNALLTEISLQRGEIGPAFNYLLLAERDLAAGEEEWFQDLKRRLLEQATVAELEKIATFYPQAPLAPAVLLQLTRLELQGGRLEKAKEWATTLQQRFPQSPEAAAVAQLLPAEPVSAAVTAIGVVLPLSGANAEEGRKVQKGLELAAAQKDLRLLVIDGGDQPESMAAAVEKLAADPEIRLVVGFFPSATAQAAATAAQKAGLPLLALTTKKDITKVGPYIFRDFVTPQLLVEALIQQVRQRWGWHQFVILAPDSRYGQTMARYFTDLTTTAGGVILAQAFYPEGGQDLSKPREVLLAATQREGASQTPAAIFIPDEAAGVATVSQALAGTPLASLPVLGTNLLSTAGAAPPAAVDGVIFADAFIITDPDPEVQAFVTAFRQEYGEFPDYLAAQGYSSLQVAAAALSGAAKGQRAAVAEALAKASVPSGFSLFRGFNPQREADIKFKLVRIEDGTFKILP